jgi:hypothetical protein
MINYYIYAALDAALARERRNTLLTRRRSVAGLGKRGRTPQMADSTGHGCAARYR